MRIHEFQAKQILREAGIAVLRGHVARSPDEAASAFRELHAPAAVLKAQIHAGGRGKGTVLDDSGQRGVQWVRSPEEARTAAARLLGKKLVTAQTGPAGQTVQQLLVEEGCTIGRELYLGAVVDRSAGRPVLMVSPDGGVEIEKVAAETPERILREHFDPLAGLHPFQVRKLCGKLGLRGATVRSADSLLRGLCRVFVDGDCSLVEINPLAVTGEGQCVPLDAKMTFDDNALFRHPEIAAMRDVSEEEPCALQASAAGLSYVKLDGNIGCLVNGAGLAMSTMDLIQVHGGQPANFLDVGGGADAAQVTEGLRILLSDSRVRAVLVNIFGGIMRCTTIAQAIVDAYKVVGFNVPLVVRLEGTEVEEGIRILAQSGVHIIAADGLTDAARKVVAAAGR